MKYLKRFLKHNDYTGWTNSSGYTTPSVAICLEDDHTHFHPFVPAPTTKGDISCVYDVRSGGTIMLYGHTSHDHEVASSADYGYNNFSEMSIDGGDWIPAEVFVTLPAGIHTVEFKMIDNTFIERGTFRKNGDDFKDYNLDTLREVTINVPLSQVLYGSFKNEYIEKVTFTHTTPPTLITFNADGHWFGDPYNTEDYHYPIYVPAESLNAYKTASYDWAAYAAEDVDRIKPAE